MPNLKYLKAFTLAEVLITLAIIGVVAAITIPLLIQNTQSRVRTERVRNIKHKLSTGVNQMAVRTGLSGFESTDEFVKELSKHMKIIKICDNDHLDSCWPYKEVNLGDDKKWSIKDTKTPDNLQIENADNWNNTVGLITGDGVSMILSYKKNCDYNVDFDGVEFDKDTGVSNALNKCISGVYDWNGANNPNSLVENSLNNDIQFLGAAIGLGAGCGFKVDKTCYGVPFIPEAVFTEEAEQMFKDGKINYVCRHASCVAYGDRWAGAVKACNGKENLPTKDELRKISDYIYSGNYVERGNSLGFGNLSSGTFFLWSGEENPNDNSQTYAMYYQGWSGLLAYHRYGSYEHAVCVKRKK